MTGATFVGMPAFPQAARTALADAPPEVVVLDLVR